MPTIFRFLWSAASAGAQQLVVDIGTPLSWGQLTGNVVNFLAASIGFLSVACFIYGAFLMTASGIEEDWRNKGKDIMIGSIVGMVIVLGAYALLRTVAFFIVA